MTAHILRVLEAVVAEVNRLPDPVLPDWTATRAYRVQYRPADLTRPTVTVMPRSLTVGATSRVACDYDVAVDVALQKKVDMHSPEELDALLEQVEQIEAWLRLRRLSDYPEAVWVATENDPLYLTDHLEQHGVFTSVLSVTYRVHE